MRSFWFSSYAQSLHWNFLVGGWLRLVQKCTNSLKVILPHPASFPLLCKCETSIMVRSLSLTIFAFSLLFPFTGIASSNSLVFLFSFWHLLPRDPELSLGSHYWPLWDTRLVASIFFGGEAERAWTYMSFFITSLRRSSENSITLKSKQNTISKTKFSFLQKATCKKLTGDQNL